jgi:cell wall-associated NlpC family hydrolase
MRSLKLLSTLLVAALGAACASSGAVPHPFPMAGGKGGSARLLPPVAPTPEPAPAGGGVDAAGSAAAGDAGASAVSPRADDAYFRSIVETAMELRGAPYRNGGEDPKKGFDCSGFTQYVYARHGIALPREVRDQFTVGTPLDPSADFLAGDLLFFTTTSPGASHVAISLGGDAFVHAPSSNGVVRVEKLTTGYWNERFLGARRLTQP